MEWIAPLIRALKEGPLGGLAVGIVGWVVLGRMLVNEMREHRLAWKKLGLLCEKYAVLISKENAKAAAREIRLAEKAAKEMGDAGGDASEEEDGDGSPSR